MSTIVYACSSNQGKLQEFALAADLSGAASFRVEALPNLLAIPPPEENGSTFEENAAIKAAFYSSFTSDLVFSDDSGLEVTALSGAPGIHSARFAGPAATDNLNNALLLTRLQGSKDRSGRFVCTIALARSGRILHTFRGEVAGEILTAPRGDNGFGYDPLFFYPPLVRSFAELSSVEKFKVSHRGRALRALVQWLAESHQPA